MHYVSYHIYIIFLFYYHRVIFLSTYLNFKLSYQVREGRGMDLAATLDTVGGNYWLAGAALKTKRCTRISNRRRKVFCIEFSAQCCTLRPKAQDEGPVYRAYKTTSATVGGKKLA